MLAAVCSDCVFPELKRKSGTTEQATVIGCRLPQLKVCQSLWLHNRLNGISVISVTAKGGEQKFK